MSSVDPTLLSVFPRFAFVRSSVPVSHQKPHHVGGLLPAPHIGLCGDFPNSLSLLLLTSLGEKTSTFKYKCRVQGHAWQTFPGMDQDDGVVLGSRVRSPWLYQEDLSLPSLLFRDRRWQSSHSVVSLCAGVVVLGGQNATAGPPLFFPLSLQPALTDIPCPPP